jgi:hypothetical protein
MQLTKSFSEMGGGNKFSRDLVQGMKEAAAFAE